MQIDPDLHDFIDQLQRELPPPRDPTDMAAQAQRYAAASRRLPSVLVPVTSGDFKLRPGGHTPITVVALGFPHACTGPRARRRRC